MPLFKLKKVLQYSMKDIPYFIFILVLIFIINTIGDFSGSYMDSYYMVFFINGIVSVVILGYGVLITKDRINHGHKLPRIVVKDVLVLGIKSLFVYIAFFLIQTLVFTITSQIFDIPMFDLEDLLMNFEDTVHMFVVNEAFHSLIFVVVGGLAFYVTTFFVEISLAMLADTNSLLLSFNLVSLSKKIRVIGFKTYILDCTSIILAIIILSYLQHIAIPIFWLDQIWETVLGFLIFATQYLGIGALYADIKDKELELNASRYSP